jgi:hypothetical protein
MATGMPFDLNQPSYPGDSTGGFEGAPRRRPGRLTAVCVIAIVLGGLGLFTSLGGLAGLAFRDKLERLANQQQQLPPGMANSMLKDQMEMQKKVNKAAQDVSHRHTGSNGAVLVFNLMFAVSLLVGGTMTLRLNPAACKFLVVVFVAAIAFEIVRSIGLAFTQLDLFAELSAIKSVGSGQADVHDDRRDGFLAGPGSGEDGLLRHRRYLSSPPGRPRLVRAGCGRPDVIAVDDSDRPHSRPRRLCRICGK